jgi:hypothetical protein
MKRICVVVVVVLSCAVPVAVAAGSPAHSSASGGTFTGKANRACTVARAELTKLPKLTPANVVSEADKRSKIISGLVTKLKAIKAPKAKATKYKSFIAETQKQVTNLKAAGDDVQAGRLDAVKTDLAKLAAAATRARRLAAQIKLSACAKS